MEYVCKTLVELTPAELEQYRALYNRIFHRDISLPALRYKLGQQIGDTAHFALIVAPEAGIVGSLGAIEVPYEHAGREYRLALTLDAMIDPAHRVDMLAMKRQHDMLFERLQARGVVGVFTKPNRNSYLYLKKILGFTDAGELHVHALPLRPLRAAKLRRDWPDAIWRGLLSGAGWLARPGAACTAATIDSLPAPQAPEASCYLRRRRDAGFLRARFGGGGYQAVRCGEGWVIYALTMHEGRLACFALESQGIGARDWLAFARHVMRYHPAAELLIWIDSAPGLRLPMLPMPRCLLPDKFHIVAREIAPTMPKGVRFYLQLSDFEVV